MPELSNARTGQQALTVNQFRLGGLSAFGIPATGAAAHIHIRKSRRVKLNRLAKWKLQVGTHRSHSNLVPDYEYYNAWIRPDETEACAMCM